MNRWQRAAARRAVLTVLSLGLSACLPDGSSFELPNPGGNGTPGIAAPSELAYEANPAVYTKGTPIPANAPTSKGAPVTSYAITPALPAGLALDPRTGVLSGTPTALSPSAAYTVTATNAGGSTTVVLTITVQDVPPSGLGYLQNTPVYSRGEAILPNTPRASGGPIVAYAVSPALPAGLSLDPETGVLSGTPAVLAPAAAYTVVGSNSGGSTSAILVITVRDLPPSGLSYSTNPVVYTKGQAITSNLPSVTGSVELYTASPPLPAGLVLNPKSGVISGTPTALATGASYTITAANTGGSTSATLNVTVNDEKPSGLAYAPNPAVYTKGAAITPNVPTAAGGPAVSFSVTPSLPAGLSLDAATGAISGTPTLVSAAAAYALTATNTGGKDTATVTITVNDVAPSGLTYSTNPAVYTKGQSIPANFPTSTGGAVVTYSATLPPGLAINPTNGIITGTPQAVSASALWRVTATNSGGSTSVDLDLTVHDAPPAALAYSSPTAVYVRGTAITANVPTSSGGAVVSYAVSPSLPAGLSLDANTGRITGTPTAIKAAASYTITATNSGGSTSTTISIAVHDIAPAGLAYSTAPAIYAKGAAITPNTPSSTGGAIDSYAVSPSLPAGLSLSPTTGVISGTPTAITPSATYTITATNTGGQTTANLTITVNDGPPVLAYATNPAVYVKGTAIATNTLSNTGGQVTGNYAVAPSLPAGLSLNVATGAITGTPTAVTATATYRVSNSNSGGVGFVDLALTVNDVPPSGLLYKGPYVFIRGVSVAPVVPSAGGGAVVSYAISPAPPSGLAFDIGTGILSGTPTAVTPTASYTVTATNSGGSTTATFSITVRPVGRFAYVANQGDGTVSMYTLDMASGRLRPTGQIAAGLSPWSVAVDPSSRFAYVANFGSNDVSQYSINPVTGALTSLGVVAAGTTPYWITVDPTGKFAYVVNNSSENISAFSINATTGALTAVGAPASTGQGSQPFAMAIHPTGKFAYVAARGTSQVLGYSIDATTGALTSLGASASGFGTTDIAIDATGKYAYVAADALRAYRIDATTGALTFVNASTSVGASSVCLDPSGTAAYAARNNPQNGSDHGVATFSIDPATGTVTHTGSSALASTPTAIAMDPSGSWVYETFLGFSATGDVMVYGAKAGVLDVLGHVATRSAPRAIAFATGAAPVVYAPKFAYVVNTGSNSVSAYTVNAATGALTSLGAAVSTGGSLPVSMAVDPAGAFAYVVNNVSNDLSVFAINATTGALTAIAGSPFSTGSFTRPQGIAIDPSGRFAFVANGSANSVTAYTLNATTGAPTAVGSLGAGTFPQGIAVSPFGPFVYAANVNASTLSQFSYDTASGALTSLGAAVATGIQAVSVAVDPRGKYAYVAAQGSNLVNHFSIGATGALTSVGTAPTGTTPTSVAVDPSGKFAFAANQTANNVSAYASDPVNGALTPVTGSPFAAGSGPVAVAVDPSGNFVYVANSGANTVSVFKLDRTSGALTAVGTPAASGANPGAIAFRSAVQ